MRWLWRAAGSTAAGLGLAAIGYATTVGAIWLRYGHRTPPAQEEVDPLVDRFMPEFDVVERHHVRVEAPAEITLAAATAVEFDRSAIIRSIFKARELVLGADPGAVARPQGLVAQMKALGWGVLAEVPGREIVMGGVTQPWKANPEFHALAPDAFLAFRDPDYVKIIWTLRADPLGADASVFRTETRVATTDEAARAKFRWYWARFAPGIVLIRWTALGLVKPDAERVAQARRR